MYHGKFQETNVKLFNENFGSNVHNRLLGVNTSQLQCINKGSIAIELIRTGSTIAKWLRSWNLIPDYYLHNFRKFPILSISQFSVSKMHLE